MESCFHAAEFQTNQTAGGSHAHKVVFIYLYPYDSPAHRKDVIPYKILYFFKIIFILFPLIELVYIIFSVVLYVYS